MTEDECRVLLLELRLTPGLIERMIDECQARQGWTEFIPVGPMLVMLARTPGAHGSRTQNFQVTIK